MVQLWITCSTRDNKEFTEVTPARFSSKTPPHLLSPPPPLSRLLRLLHLDQDVLLVGEVDHPRCEGPAHLELQQGVVPKICQVHGCRTRTVKRKLRMLVSAHFCIGYHSSAGHWELPSLSCQDMTFLKELNAP